MSALRRVQLAGLMLSALILGMGADAPPQGSTRNGYTDPTHGFTITPPKLTGGKDRCMVVAFEGPMKGGFAPNVNVLVDPVHTTRKDYLASSMAVLNQNNAKINSTTELTVGGYEAQMLDYEGTAGARRLRFRQLMVVADDAVYVVTCTATMDGFAAYQDEFEKCLQSFRPPGAR